MKPGVRTGRTAITPDVLAAVPLDRWPTRELIMHHTARLLAVRGYHGTSTRDIAEAVGVRQPSLFHHFPSKLAIIEALLSFDIDPAHSHAAELRDGPGSPAVRIYRCVRWDIAYCLASPYDLRGLHSNDVLDAPPLEPWRCKLRDYHGSIKAMIEQGVEAGELTCMSADFARQAITGLTKETIRVHGGGHGGEVSSRPDLAAGFAVRALLADPGRLDAVRRAALDADDVPWPLGRWR